MTDNNNGVLVVVEVSESQPNRSWFGDVGVGKASH